MKVTIYDNNPGPGFGQWCLKISWLLGCIFQKLVGAVDAYYGADSWEDAKAWLKKQPAPLTVVQYWGHGSPGTVWLASDPIPTNEWLSLKPLLVSDSLLWFRCCSTFQGTIGQAFSRTLANGLSCTIAGHTRIIGFFQGGLYTRTPNSFPSWSVQEGEERSNLRDDFKFWNKHTILCLQWWIPKGW